MKRNVTKMAIPNFAHDTRPKVRAVAVAMGIVGALALTSAMALTINRAQLLDQAAEMRHLGTRLAAKAKTLRSKAASMPAVSEFDKLRHRIVSLNKLNFNTSVSVGGLLDELEAILPEQVVITSLGYDRANHAVDLAAVSVSSGDLTSFFDTLNKSKLFSQVRLVDKMQVETESGTQTQARIFLQVAAQRLNTEGRS